MTKKLMVGAALSALMMSGALVSGVSAQSQNAPASSSPSAAPAAQSQPAGDTAAQSQPAGDKAAVVATQKPDQWVATKFKGTDVLGSDGKSVGAISDILFDKSGKIEAYVISVGGFLGVGSKEVALPPTAFEVQQGQNGNADKLKISMSLDQLKQAQDFARYEPPRPSTTGAGGPGLNGLSGAGTKKSSNSPPGGN
jgi:sporulation protein YlmC with PRC-barrel domain